MFIKNIKDVCPQIPHDAKSDSPKILANLNVDKKKTVQSLGSNSWGLDESFYQERIVRFSAPAIDLDHHYTELV
jgi:hypothetical protein